MTSGEVETTLCQFTHEVESGVGVCVRVEEGAGPSCLASGRSIRCLPCQLVASLREALAVSGSIAHLDAWAQEQPASGAV